MIKTYTLTIWNEGQARFSKTFNATHDEALDMKACAAEYFMKDGEAITLKAGDLAAFDIVLNG